jgi:O-antigen/teichoic acid export membrane protein
LIDRIRDTWHRLRHSKFVRDTITLQAGKILLTVLNAAAFIVLARGLGPDGYGEYQLVLTAYGLIMTLNLTGLAPGTIIRLAEAIGAGDRTRVRDLLGFFVQVSAGMAVIVLAVALIFGPLIAVSDEIARLLRVYVLILFFQPLYTLTLFTLQGLRIMRRYTLLENTAAFMESGLRIGAVLVGLGVPGVVMAHVLSAAVKAGISLIIYRRTRRDHADVLPGMGDILHAARTNSPRPYWRFGVLLAVDKNLSNLYTLLPVQLIGLWHGEAAAGFARLGLSALTYPALLFRGILTNLETRLPADVGQANYVRLMDNLRRVLRYVTPISVGVFAAFAVVAPLVVPVLGEEYIPAIPVIRILCVYGAIIGVGGVFAPVYRALNIMPVMLAVRVAGLVSGLVMLALVLRPYAEVGAAWAINAMFAVSVSLTALVVLPRITRLAREQRAQTE